MRTIQEAISEMLTENTGVHMLDSGGKDGRMWQRNQGKNFEQEPRVTWEIYDGQIDYVTVSAYHYLTEVLEISEETEKLNRIVKKAGLHWVSDVAEWLSETNGEYEAKTDLINTYNYEENISQTLVFQVFKNTFTEGYIVALQVHGGADVRGGYTNTQFFQLNGYLTGNVDIYGTIAGRDVSNTYNGHSITDDYGEEVQVSEGSEIYLDFSVYDDLPY